jgi:hypothetical protein
MTDTFTMGARNVSFIMSMEDGAGSRSIENGVLDTGDLPAGTILQASAGKLIAYTDGSTPVGILMYATDASAGDKAVAYLARDAVVNGEYLNYPAENSAGTVESTAITALKNSCNIIVRSASAVSAQ